MKCVAVKGRINNQILGIKELSIFYHLNFVFCSFLRCNGFFIIERGRKTFYIHFS